MTVGFEARLNEAQNNRDGSVGRVKAMVFERARLRVSLVAVEQAIEVERELLQLDRFFPSCLKEEQVIRVDAEDVAEDDAFRQELDQVKRHEVAMDLIEPQGRTATGGDEREQCDGADSNISGVYLCSRCDAELGGEGLLASGACDECGYDGC